MVVKKKAAQAVPGEDLAGKRCCCLCISALVYPIKSPANLQLARVQVCSQPLLKTILGN